MATPDKKLSSENSNVSNVFTSPEVRVVEASAGSGKTYALAKRYIQLLLNISAAQSTLPIRQILAITFTNKSAFEMKTRILEFLKKISLQQLSADEEAQILHPLGLLPEEASQKAFVIMEEVIHHYNYFQVQTIDKFINALLSGCAFKIGLTSNFRIVTNSQEYIQYSLDELIDRARDDKALDETFDYFLHNYLYLENRTGWFPKKDILDILTALFRHNNAYGLYYRISPIGSEELIIKKRKILELMRELSGLLPEETDKRFVKTLQSFLQEHKNIFDIDRVSDYFARQGPPVRKSVPVTEELSQLWHIIGDHLRELCEQESHSLFNPYVEIFNYTRKELRLLTAKDDVLFLEELNKRAGQLFDEDYITVEELYYRLATRFHHYLVDEFQDTSLLQWQNLEKMVEEALSTGGSLFYVGDKKQAIYGFRGGNIKLFDELKDKFDAFKVKEEFLTKNWRSQKAIVDFNNKVFHADNLKRFIQEKNALSESKGRGQSVVFQEQDLQDFTNIFRNAQQETRSDKNLGYVRMISIEGGKKEVRDALTREELIGLVKKLKKRFAYADIAILTRGNVEVELVTTWLLEENIPVASERTTNIKENYLIGELITLLQFLNTPIDNQVFASFICGDIFSKATGIKTEKMEQFLFLLRDKVRNTKNFFLYTEFRRQYPKVWGAYFDEFFKTVGLYPLYEFVISLLSRFAVLDNFSSYQGFIMHFLEIIKKQEEEATDLTSFLESFEDLTGEDLYVKISDRDAINILTVHKSKGLEFPVVILPFLGMDLQVGSQGGDNQQSFVYHKDGSLMELLRIKKKYLSFSDQLRDIYAKEYKQAFLAEMNNIYVALTRAQNEMYGFIPQRSGSSENSVKYLIPEDIFEVGRPHKYKTHRKEETPSHKVSPGEYRSWIDYMKDEFLDSSVVVDRSKQIEGEVVHDMLSQVGNLHARNPVEVIIDVMERTEEIYPDEDIVKKYKPVVERILKDEKLAEYFNMPDAEVYTEKEIVNKQGHTKRIDRLIVKEDEAWVIDFKSSRSEQEQYHQQVKEYMIIIKDMYSKKKIKGVLIYLDDFTSELVNG